MRKKYSMVRVVSCATCATSLATSILHRVGMWLCHMLPTSLYILHTLATLSSAVALHLSHKAGNTVIIPRYCCDGIDPTVVIVQHFLL